MINSIYGKVFGRADSGHSKYILNPVPMKVGAPGPQLSSDQLEALDDSTKICDPTQTLELKVGEKA